MGRRWHGQWWRVYKSRTDTLRWDLLAEVAQERVCVCLRLIMMCKLFLFFALLLTVLEPLLGHPLVHPAEMSYTRPGKSHVLSFTHTHWGNNLKASCTSVSIQDTKCCMLTIQQPRAEHIITILSYVVFICSSCRRGAGGQSRRPELLWTGVSIPGCRGIRLPVPHHWRYQQWWWAVALSWNL